jgi:SAM-dependent methyltransferase
MSVIEHGVDTAAFFCEMRRILKPGGLLVISTDYWDGPLDAGDRMLFGVPQKIFNREEVEGLVNTASRHGFKLLGQPDFSCRDRVVAWNGLNYTFLIMSFRLDQGKP